MSGNGEGRSDSTPGNKPDSIFGSWFTGRDLNFINPEAEKAYRHRVLMLQDAVQLRIPERIPVYTNIGYFPLNSGGTVTKESRTDYEKSAAARRDYLLELAPDLHGCSAIPGPGKCYELLDYRMYYSPGHGSESGYVETDYMKADEYDGLIRDPSDFLIRRYMPRVFGALKPFQRLQGVGSLLQMPYTGTYLTAFGRPDMRQALEALMAAGEEWARWQQAVSDCNRQIAEAGYPPVAGGSTLAPYDVIADTLRGTRGVMSDMYRQPDILIEAMERLTPVMVELGAESARASGLPIVFIPLHKGADDFMSDRQYRTFYWPTLKKMIHDFVDRGLVPFLFAEGEYASRLEVIRDVPVGSVIWHFDFTDMRPAKEALAGIACIAGNVPISLLNTGTPSEVEDYCKGLIDAAGKGGGFIMSGGGIIDKARAENITAMIQFTRQYGVY